jgi:phenylacetate-coenzyme A ligase PaaK-like adenylate-forming protein
MLNANETTQIERLDFDALIAGLYPMANHVLYGSPNSFLETNYLMPEVLASFAESDVLGDDVTNLEMCPACFFQTSGTSSRSKRIPFSDRDLERQKVHEAIALKKLGMTADDAVLSLGAPLPSISGWAITNGSRTVGARVLNVSQMDYDDVLDDPSKAQAATFVIGTPIVVKEIGKDIAEQRGDVRQVLPNLRTAVIFGDVLPDSLRKEIKDIWGFENVYSLYGTVEADVVATECTDRLGELELMQERLIFELIPESELLKERRNPGYTPSSLAINDVPHNTVGEILISDVARDVLPLIRYRIGDVVKVFRGTGTHNRERPSVSVLGRSKNAVYFRGIPLYEMQINSAVTTALDNDVADWRLRQIAKDAGYRIAVAASAEDKQGVEARVISALRAQRDELAEVDLDLLVGVDIVNGFDRAEIKGDAKAQRIQLMS